MSSWAGSGGRIPVRIGLQSLRQRPPDFVVIHDGARPLVTDDLIHQGLETARQHGAATAAVPVHHTVQARR